jgi:hypothetical protein
LSTVTRRPTESTAWIVPANSNSCAAAGAASSSEPPQAATASAVAATQASAVRAMSSVFRAIAPARMAARSTGEI